MPATGTDAVDEEIAQFTRHRRQFPDGQAAQVRRRCNRGEQRILVQRNGHRRASLHAHARDAEKRRAPLSWHG
jgi:hypothetical protein